MVTLFSLVSTVESVQFHQDDGHDTFINTSSEHVTGGPIQTSAGRKSCDFNY